MRQNPDSEETRLLRAELLLANEDFPGARRALGDVATKHPTVRSLSILAAVERGEGMDDAVVRGTLARALVASRGPQWVCDKCHNVMADWAPVCDSCGGFDTLTWREPDRATASAGIVPHGVEMLPLLVGAKPVQGGAQEAAPVAAAVINTQPGMVSPEPSALPKAAPVHEAPAAEIGAVPRNITPGMVARESDYVRAGGQLADDEPAMTVTDPEPEMPPRASAKPVSDSARRTIADGDVLPVRPDVEPPEDMDPISGKSR